MAFLINFNAHAVAPNVAPEPVPSGRYPVVIVETNEKAVSGDETKAYWEIVMQVISGDMQGRKIIDRLNFKNPSQQTRDIAMGTLSSIAHVTGVMQFQSSAQLHGKPFQVNVVKVKRNDDPTKDGNEVRGYLDAMGYEPGKNPGNGAAAGGDAAGAWGGGATGQTQESKPAETQWNAGGTVAQTTAAPAQTQQAQTIAQPQQTQAAANPWATHPKYIALIMAGIGPDAAVAALTAQGETPPAAAPAQAEQRMENAPSPSDIAAQAAAMFGAGATTGGDGGPTPDWANS
jgi:hypothetical protein